MSSAVFLSQPSLFQASSFLTQSRRNLSQLGRTSSAGSIPAFRSTRAKTASMGICGWPNAASRRWPNRTGSTKANRWRKGSVGGEQELGDAFMGDDSDPLFRVNRWKAAVGLGVAKSNGSFCWWTMDGRAIGGNDIFLFNPVVTDDDVDGDDWIRDARSL